MWLGPAAVELRQDKCERHLSIVLGLDIKGYTHTAHSENLRPPGIQAPPLVRSLRDNRTWIRGSHMEYKSDRQ